MFRKLFLLAAFLLTAGVAVQAQNIQFHYDFGSHLYEKQRVPGAKRTKITTTV